MTVKWRVCGRGGHRHRLCVGYIPAIPDNHAVRDGKGKGLSVTEHHGKEEIGRFSRLTSASMSIDGNIVTFVLLSESLRKTGNINPTDKTPGILLLSPTAAASGSGGGCAKSQVCGLQILSGTSLHTSTRAKQKPSVCESPRHPCV